MHLQHAHVPGKAPRSCRLQVGVFCTLIPVAGQLTIFDFVSRAHTTWFTASLFYNYIFVALAAACFILRESQSVPLAVFSVMLPSVGMYMHLALEARDAREARCNVEHVKSMVNAEDLLKTAIPKAPRQKPNHVWLDFQNAHGK